MSPIEIKEKVERCIFQVAQEQNIKLPTSLEDHHTIVEHLGFKSLDVATLTAFLEIEFHVDPFSTGMAAVTEIRTVGDICKLYARCLSGNLKVLKPQANEAQSERLLRRKKSA